MAHFARAAVLAESLDPSEWDVHFWTPERYHRHLDPKIVARGDLRTLDPDRFLELLARGAVLYSSETLFRYVLDDLAILDEARPDLVIGDFRLSLSVSAPVAGVRFGSIFNAYWSPGYRQPAIIPDLPLARVVSPALLAPVFDLVRPLVYAYHARPLNEVRRAYGLVPLRYDVRDVYTAGDLVLYPDVPELVPVDPLPPHHHFIGTCPFRPRIPDPPFWDRVMASPRPKVFVALGSSGPLAALPAVLEALAGLPVEVVLATSGRGMGSLPPNVHAAELFPYERTAARCAAVVSHGGSSGIYPALAAGAPMLAILANVDTHLSATMLERSGAGISLRLDEASPAAVRAALERLLSEPGFKERAASAAELVARHDTRAIFPRLLRRYFEGIERRRAEGVAVSW
jgi:UDP:flavonoid glycosyltransferase YjiC (YdhE family)